MINIKIGFIETTENCPLCELGLEKCNCILSDYFNVDKD